MANTGYLVQYLIGNSKTHAKIVQGKRKFLAQYCENIGFGKVKKFLLGLAS
jgi:hypothetical protein